ncbi:hypothetical protein [Alicyclobacillus macrosporangiidus]|jgi:hypothetical protein|uniref:Uncharacterized protein n=1 Tax=Alicyclobacillus macrosporangiidus TaxID=392015 RepID=A0A1I7L9T7_9BACL|nr:hypothetical protein [Alicyclobacillus macrosporangiidus]SFV06461.1 hypothetical protein SAMN05421543_1307 [Alicyclobacillus macrosporangiidus]
MTNPNKVKQDIQRDLQNKSAGALTNQAGARAQATNSTLGQFKTNAQQVRNDIQQDLSNRAGTSLTSGTNPQEVKNEINRDLQS